MTKNFKFAESIGGEFKVAAYNVLNRLTPFQNTIAPFGMLQ